MFVKHQYYSLREIRETLQAKNIRVCRSTLRNWIISDGIQRANCHRWTIKGADIETLYTKRFGKKTDNTTNRINKIMERIQQCA